MVWLAILGLAIWVLVEHNRTSALGRELEALRKRLPLEPAKEPTRAAAATHETSGITPAMTAAARAAADAPRPSPLAAPAPIATPTTQAPPTQPPRRAPNVTRASLESWLAERGLAWVGGSALVIGGAFLVGYAAQRGLFGPPMRIFAAVLLGLALLGVGEAVRRGRLAGFGGHKLVAAILSGAGAAVLYAAAWAAYGLYGFIGGLACAAILVGISAGLMGLAFLHGEALAILALGGAFAAPLIAGRSEWSLEALSLYMGVLVAAGAVIAWLRRWPAVAWANLVGVAVWTLLAAVESDSWKCLLLGLEPLAVIATLTYARPDRLTAQVGAGAVAVASLAALLALILADKGREAEGLVAGLALPFLTAALQRRGQAPSWSLAAPGLAFTLAAIVARMQGMPSLTLTSLWCLQVLALDGASLWVAWRAEEEPLASGAGALSSLALGLVAGAGFAAGPWAPLAPAVACAALALGALRLAADKRRPADQRALDIWGGASAAALLTALAVGLDRTWAPFGFAAAALGLALIGGRLRWRSVAVASAAGAALGLFALLTPIQLTQALSGGGGAAYLLAAGLAVAAASFAAARLVRADPVAAEALRTLSPLAALVGGFVFLRWLAGAKTGLPLDPLTEASIRTFLIADAGLVSLGRLRTETLAFARWRGHALMAAAALHGFLLQALIFNPRIGLFGDVAGGVILLNSLAAAYLAPALVFGLAAWRVYPSNRPAGRIYAIISLLSGVMWAFLEIRRLTQGPHLAGDLLTVGPAEALGESLALLGLAAFADRLAARAARPEPHPFHADTAHALPTIRWIAIGFALVMTALWSNPWWGPAARPLAGTGGLLAVLAGYGALVALLGRLAGDARRGARTAQADFTAYAAMLMGVILASLAVRAAFQGANLTLGRSAGQLETWTYSAVWAVTGLGFIGASRTAGRLFLRAGVALLLVTTVKVFVVDTASLSGVVRAGSFLALGVLLLAGALTARRIAQGAADAPATRSNDNGG